MNLKYKILATGVLLVALASSASAEPFFRPLLSFDSPVTAGFSSTAGYGFVAGTRLGVVQQREVSFEWHYNRWDYSASYAGYGVSGGETNMPCLINYRYHFGGNDDKVRFYAGPALGMSATTIRVTATAPGSRTAVRNTDWAFTWSASCGALIKLSPKTDLDVGYRYLQAQGRDFAVGTTAVSVDERRTHMLYTGLNIRF